jgi:hypothetical protein
MGYNLYITRQVNWYDEDASKKISMEEWKATVEQDADMRLDNEVNAVVHGKVIKFERDGIAVWTLYSKTGKMVTRLGLATKRG